jgi:hypothetical protein
MKKIFLILMFLAFSLNLVSVKALEKNAKIDERTLLSIYFIEGEKT